MLSRVLPSSKLSTAPSTAAGRGLPRQIFIDGFAFGPVSLLAFWETPIQAVAESSNAAIAVMPGISGKRNAEKIFRDRLMARVLYARSATAKKPFDENETASSLLVAVAIRK